MRNLLETIYKKAKAAHAYQPMEDLYFMCREAMKTDVGLGVEYLKLLSAECERAMHDRSISGEQVVSIYDLHKRVCFTAAPYDLTATYSMWSGTGSLTRSSILPGVRS